MSPRGPIRILVTGFGAFPGAPRNPSAEIVRRLARERDVFARLGIAVETRVLPVVFGAAPVDASGCDAVLHVGLAGRRRDLCVETRARNRRSLLHRDAAGLQAAGLVLAPGESRERRARVPAERLVVALRRAGVPARASIDAGDYICNETLWNTLAGPAPPAGFIHVPSPRRSGVPLEAMVRAIAAAVRVLANEARRPA